MQRTGQGWGEHRLQHSRMLLSAAWPPMRHAWCGTVQRSWGMTAARAHTLGGLATPADICFRCSMPLSDLDRCVRWASRLSERMAACTQPSPLDPCVYTTLMPGDRLQAEAWPGERVGPCCQPVLQL